MLRHLRALFEGRRFLAVLFFAIVVVNIPSLNGPYVLDDIHTVRDNASVQTLDNFFDIWTTGQHYSSFPANWGYRPVTTLSNILMWQLGGGATWAFRVLKWFLFFLIGLLVFEIWRRLMPEIDELWLKMGVLLFAVNTVQSQLMGYISATSSLLATLYICFCIYQFLLYRENGESKNLSLSLLGLALALLSKEEGVVAVGLVPLVQIYLNRLQSKPLFESVIKLLAIYGLVGGGFVYLVMSHYESAQNIARGDLSSWNYFMTQWAAYIRYMALYFVPVGLNADNMDFGFAKSIFDLRVILSLAANIVLLGLGVKYWRKFPVLLFCLLWFYISISPTSSVVVLGEPVNDHRSLTGYIGLGMLAMMGWVWLFQNKRQVGLVLYSVCILLYSGGSLARATYWADDEKLWQDTVAKNPNFVRAYNNLAVVLIKKNRFSQALDALNRCARLQSNYAYCYMNRAIVHGAMGRDDLAVQDYEVAIQNDTGFVSSRIQLARFLRARGYLVRPLELLKEVDSFTKGGDLDVRTDLIEVHLELGQIEEAKALFVQAGSRFGDHPKLLKTQKIFGQ